MRCFLTLLALSLSLGCSRSQPAGRRGVDVPSVRIALVTDLKGYLEPCGCTSDPLGGIDRLAAQLRALREGSAPVVVVMAGDTFFDTATIERVRVDQASRNAKTLAGILSGLDVAAVLPGPSDRAQPSETLDALRAASEFPWLAMERWLDDPLWTAFGVNLLMYALCLHYKDDQVHLDFLLHKRKWKIRKPGGR